MKTVSHRKYVNVAYCKHLASNEQSGDHMACKTFPTLANIAPRVSS